MSDDEERRGHPRYSPDPWLPVVFGSPRWDLQTAGHIVDISGGGARIVAPPSCPVPLAWGDPFVITIAYSESSRRFGFEGIELPAVVVRVVSDAQAYTVNAMFRQQQLHDRVRDYLAILATGDPVDRTTTTHPILSRR